MRLGAFRFEGRWGDAVRGLGETGMGYIVVTVMLKDGRSFPQTLIDSGHVTRIRGLSDIPFTEDDIAEIKRSDEKWDWKEEP